MLLNERRPSVSKFRNGPAMKPSPLVDQEEMARKLGPYSSPSFSKVLRFSERRIAARATTVVFFDVFWHNTSKAPF